VGDFDPNLSDHCPITVKILSRSIHNEPELALRPKHINIKWSKTVEEQFTANLSCTNFKGIIDNISATNEKICSGFGHDESGIVLFSTFTRAKIIVVGMTCFIIYVILLC
jgi:hypothetical protein